MKELMQFAPGGKAPLISFPSYHKSTSWFLLPAIQFSILTSWLYSKNTWKFKSFLKIGCAATRHKNTSCIATVFLNIAKYSLKTRNKTDIRNSHEAIKLEISLGAALRHPQSGYKIISWYSRGYHSNIWYIHK